jgi:type VI secretion system protein ImpJ
MHLTPQHFQAQRRYHDDQVARTLAQLAPWSYGLASIAIDDEALRNGTFVLQHARGVLPDGTVFHAPDADDVPPPLAVGERFSPTRDTHLVYLALPAWRPDDANIGEQADSATRYRVREDVLVDESSGDDPTVVRFAARNLMLLFDDEPMDGLVAMPIACLRRDGQGHFARDAEFVPPVLQLAASERLLQLTRDIVGLLDAKGSSLSATISQAPAAAAGGAAAYMGNELATRWLLHAVRSADAPLRHLLLTRRAHPEQLYAELARLAGALCTFSLTSHPRDVPPYDHLTLTDTFAALERQLRRHLDVVISSRTLVLPLQQGADLLHSAPVSDPRAYEPGTRWFLAVRAELSPADLVDRVVRLTKTCASKFVMELVRRAYNGLPTEYVPMPPAALAPRPDSTYFELTMSGPCAASLRESREIGVYVPDAIPGAYLELVVLLPQ